MTMLDATERARPIMELVWDLENRIRAYQAREKARVRPFQVKWFVFGFLAGAAAVSALWLTIQ